MRIVLSVLLIEAFIGLFAYLFIQSHPFRDGVAVTTPTIVKILSSTGTCTGFVAGRGLIATAGHCVNPTDTYQVIEYSNGATRPYKIVAYVDKRDCIHDWALLMADTGDLQPVTFGEAPKATQIVYSIGYGRGVKGQTIKRRYLLGAFADQVGMLGGSLHGESGSPLFDEHANVFAVLVCGTDRATLGSRSQALANLVRQMRRGQ